MTQAASPATTIWVMDNSVTKTGNANYGYFIAWDGFPNLTVQTNNGVPEVIPAYGGFSARHLETCNVLYLDGHVKASKLNALLATRTSGGQTVHHLFTLEDEG